MHILRKKEGCVNILNNVLQKLRWERNWSQTQLSIRSNVPQSVISTIENNINENPSVLTALKLSRALSVKVEDIFILQGGDTNGRNLH